MTTRTRHVSVALGATALAAVGLLSFVPVSTAAPSLTITATAGATVVVADPGYCNHPGNGHGHGYGHCHRVPTIIISPMPGFPTASVPATPTSTQIAPPTSTPSIHPSYPPTATAVSPSNWTPTAWTPSWAPTAWPSFWGTATWPPFWDPAPWPTVWVTATPVDEHVTSTTIRPHSSAVSAATTAVMSSTQRTPTNIASTVVVPKSSNGNTLARPVSEFPVSEFPVSEPPTIQQPTAPFAQPTTSASRQAASGGANVTYPQAQIQQAAAAASAPSALDRLLATGSPLEQGATVVLFLAAAGGAIAVLRTVEKS